MSNQAPLDLRILADVESPEVVREALRAFRRRLWTRYVWIGLAIVLAALAFVAGNRPSDLHEEMERANVRSFPEAVWRVGDASVSLVEVADLGDTMGLHFVALPDPGTPALSVWVDGAVGGVTIAYYDFYSEVPKSRDVTITVGPERCNPGCEDRETLIVDLRELDVPEDIWRHT